MVIVNFIRDAEVGMFARAKRTGSNISTKLSTISTLASHSGSGANEIESDGSESDSKKTD